MTKKIPDSDVLYEKHTVWKKALQPAECPDTAVISHTEILRLEESFRFLLDTWKQLRLT